MTAHRPEAVRLVRAIPLGPTSLYAGAVLLLGALILISTKGTLPMAIALVVAIGLLGLVVLGPELAGSVLMVGALGCAPMNALYAPGLPSFLTVTDVLFVGGIGLLIPRLVVGRPRMDPTYKIGALLLLVTGLLTGVLTEEGPLSLFFFLRLVIAAVILPLAIAMWQPTATWLRALAWAYVVGQIVSDAWGIIHTGVSGDGRAAGITEHPNYFALAGQTALALLIYLYYQTPPQRRWIVFVAAGLCAHSVYVSGSRASLVCVALLLVLWPLLERSAVGWFLLLAGSLMTLVFAGVLINDAQPGSALYRLKGGGSAQGSDEARTMQIHKGIQRFWDHPLTGNGFSNVFDIHNVYLQMAVAGGVVAAIAFIVIMVSLMKPVLSNPPNRLAYVGISYAAIAMLGPAMWDRLVWAPLALIFARSATEQFHPDPVVGPPSNEDRPRPRAAIHPHVLESTR